MAIPGGSARRFAFFLGRPSRSTLCARWPGSSTGIQLRSIANVGPDSDSLSSTSWMRLLSRAVLDDEELDTWAAMAAGRRRAEWLLGRVALKDAVRTWAIQRYERAVAPRAMRIETTSAGAPFVVSTELDDRGGSPAVSLAHCRTLVLAAAGEPGSGLGVDVEARDRNVATLARVLTPEEATLVSGAERNGVSVLDVLVAKEAAAKALGIGLGGSMARWPVVDADREGRQVVIRAPEPHRQLVPVDLVRHRGVVVALAKCDLDHL